MENEKMMKVKVSYTNALGMKVKVTKLMTRDELKEEMLEKKVSLDKVIA